MTKCLRGCGEMGCCHPNLTDEFIEAVDLAAEGCAYTSDYFKEKWRMQETLDRLLAIRNKLRPFATEACPNCGGDGMDPDNDRKTPCPACRESAIEAETWDCLDCGSKNLASICPTKCPVCNGKRTFLTEAGGRGQP